MKKPFLTISLLLVAGVVLYYLVLKPIQKAVLPPSLEDIYNEKVSIFKEQWNGDKWQDFAALDNDTYVSQIVISNMLLNGDIAREHLTSGTQYRIDLAMDGIRGSQEWFDQVKAQVPSKYATVNQSIFFNAVYVVMQNGQLKINFNG